MEATLEAELIAALPENLGDPFVLRLQAAGFLSIEGLRRLEATCALLAPLVHRRSRAVRVLDAGCGRGSLGRHLADRLDAAIVGVDNDQAWLGRGSDVIACLTHAPFAARSFCLVLAIECLYLVESPAEALRELRRVLVNGGYLVASAYRIARSDAPEHSAKCWRQRLRRSGFVIESWTDTSAEWRAEMSVKHARRLSMKDELVRRFGAPAFAACDVSSQMLGTRRRPGFIARNARWEFVARTL